MKEGAHVLRQFFGTDPLGRLGDHDGHRAALFNRANGRSNTWRYGEHVQTFDEDGPCIGQRVEIARLRAISKGARAAHERCEGGVQIVIEMGPYRAVGTELKGAGKLSGDFGRIVHRVLIAQSCDDSDCCLCGVGR